MSTASQHPAIAVRIDKITKSYGDQTVLHGIDLTIEPGEIFVIMGPSGSGKSVLLRQVIGLEQPQEGQVLLDKLPAHSPDTRDKIHAAMVFQSGALFNSMSVFDNLALYLREHRLYQEADIKERVMNALDMLSIADAAHKIPAELSGGMRKRVSVARAIVMEPQLILYDEPTSELDPVMAATTTELIATVRKEMGVTSIVVTHDRQLAEAIADRIAILFDGRLSFLGTIADLKACNDEQINEFLNPKINLDNPRFRNKGVNS